MADLFENIAPSWVTNHLYQLGDVVLYNKKLYQCTDKHTSSNDIDLDKFKPHTLADMVAGTTQLENFADMTVVSDVVTNDDTYTYLEMPNNGVVSDKTKIATLNSNLAPKPKLLWENPDPGSPFGFSAQKISIDLTDYEAVIIEFAITPDYLTDHLTRLLVYKNDNLEYSTGVGRVMNTLQARALSNIDSTGITFTDARHGNQVLNGIFIPLRIYGINLKLA